MQISILPAAGVLSKRDKSGLKHWWKLGTDAKDSTGKLDGLRSGGAAFTTFAGKQCVSFAAGGYVELPAMTFGATPWTISTWYSAQDLANYGPLFAAANSNSLFQLKISPISEPSAPGRMYFYAASSIPAGSKFSSQSLTTGSWKLLTFTYDGARLKMFIGNTQVGDHAVTYTPVTSAMRLGSNAAEVAHGYQRDVRVYDKALSVQEIADLVALG